MKLAREVSRRSVRIQRPIRGMTRRPFATSLIREIEMMIESEADYWGVSRSFVIAAALADAWSIDEQERPSKPEPRRKRR